jgi:hypothetical protein
VFAAAYVLNAWVDVSISPYAVIRPLLVAMAAALVVTLVGWVALRDAQRGGLLAAGAILFVILGREMALIARNATALLPTWEVAILAGLIAALTVAGILVVRRSGRRFGGLIEWTRGLNVLSAALLLLIVGTGVSRGMVGQALDDLHQGVALDSAADRSGQPAQGPDIYVVLLDGYPRADVLADQFAFDNSSFLDGLEGRGFEVSEASHSNYMLTQLTLTSLLYMDLLDDVPAFQPLIDHSIPKQPTARRLLNSNPVIDVLRQRGYTIGAFAATYEDVSLRKADVFINGPQLNEFEWQLVGSTFLLDLVSWMAPDLVPGQQRALIDSAFDHATQVARDHSLGPRFLLAHVLAPRTPLVYGPNGEALDPPVLRRLQDTAAGNGLTEAEFRTRLVGQVQYVNRRTLQMVDAILAASPEPPIIIVFSDHGTRTRTFNPATATADEIRERFGTLFAAYTPGQKALFPADITPAGVMGRVFHAYFGIPFTEPEPGIFASEANDAFRFVRLGDELPAP